MDNKVEIRYCRRENFIIDSMSYDLNGKKILICINVLKYGAGRDRIGSEKDEQTIIDTFKERVYLR